MKLIRTALATIVVAAAITSAAAQSGALTIKVVDGADQTPLPGATVVLSNALQLVGESAVQTNIDGLAEFPILRPGGGYIVQVAMPGYATVRQDEIRVSISGAQTLTITLGEAITEHEKVVATRDVVDLEKTNQSTTFGDEFIQDLPVQGRFYTNVLTLAPGVQDSDMDGNPNVHGARERDFATIVGGVSNVDPLTGLQLSNVNIDSIEEIEVITAGAGVEYGRAQGGFANVIEKQGSNQFEGLFNFIFRSGALDGNGATGLTGDDVPDFDWVQPALQISGPILRDKLWYRLSYEYLKREDPINVSTAIAVTTYTQTTSSNMVTWQASRRNKLTFSYLNDPWQRENFGVSSTRPTETTQTIEQQGPTYRMAWTAPYSPKLLVDSTVAYQDTGLEIRPTEPGVLNNCVTGDPFFEQAQCFDTQTGQTSGSHFTNWSDDRQRLTVRTQANIFGGRFWGSSHQFKVGFVVENERYQLELERRPDMTFTERVDEENGFEKIAIVSARVSIPASSVATAKGTNWAIYAEDQIKPLSNLTLTLGARVDTERIASEGYIPFDPDAEANAYFENLNPNNPAPVNQGSFTAYEAIQDFMDQVAELFGFGDDDQRYTKLNGATKLNWERVRRQGNVDIDNTNVSPFLSVSWDPFKTGKTKFSAAIGRHYDKIFLAIPLVELEPATTDLNFRATNVDGNWEVGEPCGEGKACVSPAASISTVDRDLSTPYQDEFTFSVERELAAETAIAFTYIQRRFEDQFQDIDVNHVAGDFGKCQLQLAAGMPFFALSPGEGDELVDLYTGETYIDTDPGDGDGRIDDCSGDTVFNPGGGEDPPVGYPPEFAGALVRPDGFADAYLQNPGWGEYFVLGNFNTTQYEAFVLELNRRQYRNWQMNASYTWSEAVGDAEDYRQGLGDDRTILNDEFGYLSYDQRHSVKINATTIVPWAGGFRFGTAIQWQSGYPYSITERTFTADNIPPGYPSGNPTGRARTRYVTGQRNDHRNESWWNFDIHLAKEFNLNGGVNMQVTADVFNLFNDDSLRIFGQTNGFNGSVRRFGRQFQLGLRVAF